MSSYKTCSILGFELEEKLDKVKDVIQKTVREAIKKYNINKINIGNYSMFDQCVERALIPLQLEFDFDYSCEWGSLRRELTLDEFRGLVEGSSSPRFSLMSESIRAVINDCDVLIMFYSSDDVSTFSRDVHDYAKEKGKEVINVFIY